MLRFSPALVVFLLGPGFSPRLALCIGVEGHRAIEPVVARCCDLATHPGQSDSRDRNRRCSPSCTDTLLTPAVTALRLDGAGLLALEWDVGTAPICSLFDPCLQASMRSTLGNDYAPASRPPRTLRTTADLR